jgi:hypothetical protein
MTKSVQQMSEAAPRSVRGVPDPLWRELVVEAAVQNRPIGALLSEAILDYLLARHRDAVRAQPERAS